MGRQDTKPDAVVDVGMFGAESEAERSTLTDR
jgi:hypothetical protein